MSVIATDYNIMNAFKSNKWWFIENNHNTAIKVLIENHFSSILLRIVLTNLDFIKMMTYRSNDKYPRKTSRK